MRETAEYHNLLVRVERRNISSTLVTLQRRKDEGGWDLIHIAAKSCALFLNRLRQQGLRSGTITAEWLRTWGPDDTEQEPAFQRPDTRYA